MGRFGGLIFGPGILWGLISFKALVIILGFDFCPHSTEIHASCIG